MKKTVLRVFVLSLVLSLAMVAFTGCSNDNNKNNSSSKNGPKIIVSSKTFTEALLLGTMTYDYLEELGYPVENKVGLGEMAVIRPALETGQINCTWEYTGTILINVMKHEPSYDEEECYETVRAWDEKNGIIWLPYAKFQNTYCFVARKEIVDKYNLKTISDMAEAIKNGAPIRYATSQEWLERPDSREHFEKIYDFKYPDKLISLCALGMGLEAVRAGQADVAQVNTTEARIAAYGLTVLEDDRNCFPVYNPAPLFKKEIIDAYPEIPDQMQKLTDTLDTETIMELNKRVDIDKKSVEEVTKEFLKEKGLIK